MHESLLALICIDLTPSAAQITFIHNLINEKRLKFGPNGIIPLADFLVNAVVVVEL
jgi:hypothetical protein